MTRKQITRAVTLDDVDDLLDAPPRAHAAYVVEGRIDAGPVSFERVDGRYFIVAPPGIEAGERISLLIDEGLYNSELRGVRINGALAVHEPVPRGLAEGQLEIVPSSIVAWDYGAMRRTTGAS